MIGSSGTGPIGYPSSSTSGRVAPLEDPCSFFTGEGPRTDELPLTDALRRRIGGGIASSSSSIDSFSIEASSSGGSSE